MKDRTSELEPGRSLLAVAFYLVGLALLADAIAQALVVGGPEAPLWSVRWRFGFTGVAYLQLPVGVLGLAVFALTGAVARQRLGLMASAVLNGAVAVVILAGLLMFLLDATQIGAGVPDTLRQGFSITVAQTALTGGLGFILLASLALGSARMARQLRRARRPGGSDSRSGLVVGTEG